MSTRDSTLAASLTRTPWEHTWAIAPIEELRSLSFSGTRQVAEPGGQYVEGLVSVTLFKNKRMISKSIQSDLPWDYMYMLISRARPPSAWEVLLTSSRIPERCLVR